MNTLLNAPILDLYDRFEQRVIALIKKGETERLNNQEITLLIDAPMQKAARLRRVFKVRFAARNPRYAQYLSPTRHFNGRAPKRTWEELDNLFAEHFDFTVALTLKNKMEEENLSVHQALGRFVGEGVLVRVHGTAMLARYGEYIWNTWRVGKPSQIKRGSL